jgi:hypothetical protein
MFDLKWRFNSPGQLSLAFIGVAVVLWIIGIELAVRAMRREAERRKRRGFIMNSRTAPSTMRRLAVALSLLLIGCQAPSSASRPADFDAAFDRSVEAYTQYVLPNSMAQAEGTDLNSLQEQRLRLFEESSKPLRSRDGVAFLDRRLSSETDELVLICGIRILEEGGQRGAREVIRRYMANPEPTVAEHETAALAKLANAR